MHSFHCYPTHSHCVQYCFYFSPTQGAVSSTPCRVRVNLLCRIPSSCLFSRAWLSVACEWCNRPRPGCSVNLTWVSLLRVWPIVVRVPVSWWDEWRSISQTRAATGTNLAQSVTGYVCTWSICISGLDNFCVLYMSIYVRCLLVQFLCRPLPLYTCIHIRFSLPFG